MRKKIEKGSSRLEFGHYGQALLNQADEYEKLPAVILEYIQNSLDVGADHITVSISFKNRTICIMDNGDGIGIDGFEEALRSVGVSSKPKDKMGRYGLGLISALGKCKYFTFTSCASGSADRYRTWTFNTDDILSQKEKVEIPNQSVPALHFSRGKHVPGKETVSWKTRIEIHDFIRDNVLSRISVDELSDSILERFSVPMKKLNAVVDLKMVDSNGTKVFTSVQALSFAGERIPQIVYSGIDSGNTTFDLFLSKKKKGKTGKVSVGISGDPFRIGFSDFAGFHKIFPNEIIEVLSSGVFEGYILSEKCELDRSRKGFKENDSLLEFCSHIEKWVNEEGLSFYEESIDREKSKKYQFFGVRAMKAVENILKKPEFSHLMEVVLGFKRGTTGENHTKISNTETGKQNVKSVRVTNGSEEEKRTQIVQPKIPEKPKENDHPFSVVGETGRKRIVVKGHSTGLQFRYDQFPGRPILWELDSKMGILTFNVRHDLWSLAEKSGSHVLIKFQAYVALAALNTERFPGELVRDYAMSEIAHTLQLLISWKKGV